MKNSPYQIAFETGIGGGSITLFERAKMLGYRVNNSSETKADFLIRNISGLLSDLKIRKEEIGNIYCSVSPGSQTALKVGIAAAKGLRSALDVTLTECDLFQSITGFIKKSARTDFLVLLPVSKNGLELKLFDKESNLLMSEQMDSKELPNLDMFINKMRVPNGNKDLQITELFAPVDLIFESQKLNLPVTQNPLCIQDLGKNLSQYLVFYK